MQGGVDQGNCDGNIQGNQNMRYMGKYQSCEGLIRNNIQKKNRRAGYRQNKQPQEWLPTQKNQNQVVGKNRNHDTAGNHRNVHCLFSDNLKICRGKHHGHRGHVGDDGFQD